MNTSSVDSVKELINKLREWAQNEEMVDQYYTEHGKDCLRAAEELKRLLQIERINSY